MKNLALSPSSGALISFDDEKLKLIKSVYGRGLESDEFALFMSVAKSKGLDPVLGQIHPVKRDGKLTIQVGIDGYRLIASRTGQHAGTDLIHYKYKGEKLNEAVCTVYRLVGGLRVPYTASAVWGEYCPTGKQDFMWRKMPETMLGKCAEAKALRMAFPGDLGGVYVEEEMQQMKDVTPVDKEVQQLNERFDDKKVESTVTDPSPKAICEVCKTELVQAKDGKLWWYCVNWAEEKKNGVKHTKVSFENYPKLVARQNETVLDVEPSFGDDENVFK